jgi:ferritin-like metal-binding protein YciE
MNNNALQEEWFLFRSRDATLQEEKKTNAALSQLAITVINYEAEAA